jgi:hypothetical protein
VDLQEEASTAPLIAFALAQHRPKFTTAGEYTMEIKRWTMRMVWAQGDRVNHAETLVRVLCIMYSTVQYCKRHFEISRLCLFCVLGLLLCGLSHMTTANLHVVSAVHSVLLGIGASLGIP